MSVGLRPLSLTKATTSVLQPRVIVGARAIEYPPLIIVDLLCLTILMAERKVVGVYGLPDAVSADLHIRTE